MREDIVTMARGIGLSINDLEAAARHLCALRGTTQDDENFNQVCEEIIRFRQVEASINQALL